MKIKLLITFALMGCHLMADADDITIKHQLIDNASYPTQDLAVASLNVMDYGADPTGKTDQTALFQKLLDRLANVGNPQARRGDYRNQAGGVLYVPAGRYLFKGQLVIPTGVTLRGDWKKPEAGNAIEGTVLAVDYAEGSTDEEQAFIIMQNSSEVSHLAFWYPNQKADDVKVYPPTIHYGQVGMWGNEYCNARYITLVNSYIGIQYCTSNGGGCPNIFHLYGTPLYKGIQIDCISDVGRFDQIHFAPGFWAGSQLPSAPSESTVSSWLRQNATGFVMRKNDWSYTCNMEIEGYHVGMITEKSPEEANSKGQPNGHNYGWTLRNCQTGLLVTAISNAGARYTRVNTPGCEVGIHLQAGASGPASFYGCDLEGSQQAVLVDADAGSPLILTDCTVDGATLAQSGQLIATGNRFNGDVTIGSAARTVYTGNTLAQGARFENKSMFKCAISNNAADLRALPAYQAQWLDVPATQPGQSSLYVVTDSKFGAKPYSYGTDVTSAADCTRSIQKALDQAAQDGGGIVYLPAGHYRMNGRLSIPSKVELKGASDIASVPRGQGAILEVLADKGNENAQPFITMAEKSGLRGITVNYPTQDNPKAPTPYPYTIRGNADCYIVNLALRTAYRGIDLFTNKCDRHYVDYVSGHAFRNVIRIGGDSQDGVVSNIQCNTIAYACGDETKFGAWPNSEKMANSSGLHYDQYAYSQNKEQLDFMVVGDCTGEVLYNNFLFGCNQGIVFQNDGNGGAKDVKALGNAIDGAMFPIVVNGVGDDLDVVNSQLVALNQTGDYVIDKEIQGRFVTMGADAKHTLTLMGSDNWGNGAYFANVQGGTLRLQQAHLAQSGSVNTFDIGENGSVVLTDGQVQNVKALVSESGTMEGRLSLKSSVIDLTGAKASRLNKVADLLTSAWQFNSSSSSLLSREGWVATANRCDNIANQAIDGKPGTRWTTLELQSEGEWLAIDMQKPQTFNMLILDTSADPSDGPAGYVVEVATTEDDWKEVASGSDGGALLVVTFPQQTARYIRITQTGTKPGNYWSVHELYVAKTDTTTGINEVAMREGDEIGKAGFYTLSGLYVDSPSAPGIYIDKNTHKKVIVR